LVRMDRIPMAFFTATQIPKKVARVATAVAPVSMHHPPVHNRKKHQWLN
jgi:hypothetical protein